MTHLTAWLRNPVFLGFCLVSAPQVQPLNTSLSVVNSTCVKLSWVPPLYPNRLLGYKVCCYLKWQHCLLRLPINETKIVVHFDKVHTEIVRWIVLWKRSINPDVGQPSDIQFKFQRELQFRFGFHKSRSPLLDIHITAMILLIRILIWYKPLMFSTARVLSIES